jgi:hypothetical protein
MPRLCRTRSNSGSHGPEAALDTVAHNGPAQCFCHREPEARAFDRYIHVEPRTCFQHKNRKCAAQSAAQPQKLRTFFQCFKSHRQQPFQQSRQKAIPLPASRLSVSARLGRQTLAALRAAPCENLHAACRFHALTEAMAALAHQFARLICALHVKLRLVNSSAAGVFCLFQPEPPPAEPGLRVIGDRHSKRQIGTALKRRRSYRNDNASFGVKRSRGV